MDLTLKTLGCCSSAKRAAPTDADYLNRAISIPPAPSLVRAELRARLVEIPGGFFDMGTRKSTYPADLDSPRRRVKVSGFRISPFTVTAADFAAFVDDTGYQTVAEVENWSYVFHLLLANPADHPNHPPRLPWWRQVFGASWAAPAGPGSSWQDTPDHPAVHIAWFDALAYANWAGLRLPREAEWERAARGGLRNMKFPWGNSLVPTTGHAMNVWQGDFPFANTSDDGFIGTCPVDTYAPNGFGLYNMTGNVWEWVADYYGPRPQPDLTEIDPTGPATGTIRIQRGGSFLCHASYCDRYHVHSRTATDPDSSMANCGFRVAADF